MTRTTTKSNDLKDREFEKWTVLREVKGHTKRRWLCRCKCGLEKEVDANSLLTKSSQGCFSCRNTTHGQSRSRIYRLWSVAKARAKRAGIPYSLRWQDIEVPSHCPLLGIPIQFSNQRFNPTNPSLDRLDPTKGYTPENVWIISWRANVIKHNASLEELEMLASNLRKKLKPT